MCGIFGIWNFDRQPVDLTAVQLATTRLRHRGPDDEGYVLVNTQTGQTTACSGQDTTPHLTLPSIENGRDVDLVLGSRRLAILDLSVAGHQPMSDPHQRYWIVFNGEVYNYLALRAELSLLGYSFRSQTDTEVVLAAYQHWGTACLQRLNGMCALAIWDGQERSLFLARDRFGIKPLYYIYDEHRIVFASEVKALIGKHGVSFQPNDEAIYRYLTGGPPLGESQGHTWFQGVFSLPSAHWLKLSAEPGRVTPQRYWCMPDLPHIPPLAMTEAVEQYRDLLIDAVKLRLQSDVPIGSCLSGGLDSSSIVCIINHLMAKRQLVDDQIGERLKTFSAVYDTTGRYNERSYIEKMLNVTNVEGDLVFPTVEQLRADIEQIIWHQEIPFYSTSIFAQWCVMRQAHKRGVKVLLDGQGADESLGGYRPFQIFLRDMVSHAGLRSAWRESLAIQSVTGLSAGSLMAQSLLLWPTLPSTRALRRRRARQRVDTAGLQPDWAARFDRQTVAHWTKWPEHTTLDQHLKSLVEESGLSALLRYEDCNAMAFSVETRLPYLDYRLVELSFTTAAAWRIHDGWTKWVLRKAMEDWVPNEIAWRKDKVGFETPQENWLGQWLKAEPNLLGPQSLSRDYLCLDDIQNKLKSSYAPSTDGSASAWHWVNLEMWLRAWHSMR